MLNAYERQLILSYLSNAASHFHHTSSEARDLADWVFDNHDLLALEGESRALDERRPSKHHREEFPAQEWNHPAEDP